MIDKIISGLTLHSTLFDLTFYVLPLQFTKFHKKFILLLATRKQKSVNLQFNTVGRWDNDMIVPPSDGPMFILID